MAEERSRKPATTPEQQENRMINLAYDLAEQQLRDGTASAQVTTHFLKLGSSREKLEQEKISMEISLGDKKKELMDAGVKLEVLVEDALNAMREYKGAGELPPDTIQGEVA